MKHVLLALSLMFGSSLALAAAPSMIHVADLQKAMAAKTPVFIFDANTPATRTKEGVIPGAKPLPSVSDYDTALLPADKNAHLVFYCANTACTASHSAAKRALEAGYKNVDVMADGIQGWKKAGQKTDKGG